MKISSLDISGFRAFSRPQSFELNADAVILTGANGQGKTSFFDAILWAIAGAIPRLRNPKNVVSMYSPTGEARVVLDLLDSSGEHAIVTRAFDGDREKVFFEYDGQTRRGEQANVRLLEVLWPDCLATEDSAAALKEAITHSVYLQQDLVRNFLEAEDNKDRFRAVSELVGAGRITELQAELESSKRAWVRTTNAEAADDEALRGQLIELEGQLGEIEALSEDAVDPTPLWIQWWKSLRANQIKVDNVPSLDSPKAPSAVDTAVRSLQVHLQKERRLQDFAAELLVKLKEGPGVDEASLAESESLRRGSSVLEQEVFAARQKLDRLRKALAQQRRQQVETEEKREQLRALARLALKHLGERCPVCDQTYDRDHTEARLENVILEPGEESARVEDSGVQKLSGKIEQLEQKGLELARNIREKDSQAQRLKRWHKEVDRLLQDLGITRDREVSVKNQLEAYIRRSSERGKRLAGLKQQGEDIAFQISIAAQLSRKSELKNEIAKLRLERERKAAHRKRRELTATVAERVIEKLRHAGSEIVRLTLLKEVEPVFESIYSRVDPHPTFKLVKFLTSLSYGKGRLDAEIEDPFQELSTDSPLDVLSSSQGNVLAVSIFLSFSLGMCRLPLDSVILDDPLQSVDDVNLLGLIDLFRRIKEKRQLFVSTHEDRFVALLQRKLRPVFPQQRTLFINFSEWNREGPTVETVEVPGDAKPLRIAS